MANGWVVHQAETAEAYDILAKDPLNGEYAKIQVKSVRKRDDRGGDLVICARKGNGAVYDRSEADYVVGVWAVDGEIPRVWILENRMCGEYWASEARASERWVELSIALNRDLYAESAGVTAQ
ncbi:hypothetical protein [Paenibacillus sp. YN15]|uniref:hypothetical protein n=1 Tax=Paenibacillus sp. YN15 TaxID=1742774 RepID=UPI000DCDD69F|nr:hypothetical protein [Paenibacillus sp. YN15]RAU96876.1 hypothetical protein DQG13_19805 [Paenibacillus sp. YN15]